ncbi:MAG: hypothetical protein AAGF12_43190 [Myxococcota bacterium]
MREPPPERVHRTVSSGSPRWVIETGEAASDRGEDRLFVEAGADPIIGLADGAGGRGRGAAAAEAVIEAVRRSPPAFEVEAVAALVEVDEALPMAGGETTGIVLRVTASGMVTGASVGDSQAFVRRGDDWLELTAGQSRKPRLGNGGVPIPFRTTGVDAVLIGTDGLFKYAPWPRIVAFTEADRPDAAKCLLDDLRLPSGALRDDVAFALLRRER